MGTPAVINLIDSDTNERYTLYHHYDGYPDGVGRDLAVLVGNLNAGWWMIRPAPLPDDYKDFWQDPGPDTSMIRLRDWMVNNGVPSGNGLDKDYEVADGINWGASYRYDVVRSGPHWELHCFGYDDTGYHITHRIGIPEYTSGSEETKYWVSMRMTQKELDSIGAHEWGGEKPDLAYGHESHLWKENGESIYAIRLNDRKGMGAGWLSRFNKGSTKKRFTPILKRRKL